MIGTKWIYMISMAAAAVSLLGSPAKGQPVTACPISALSALPAIICFSDLTDGPPTVTTNISGAVISTGSDTATVSFTGVSFVSTVPLPRSGVVTETAGDFNPPNSDVATLSGGPNLATVLFQSDTIGSVPALGTIVATVVEDGTFQLLSLDQNLSVYVRSDVGGSEIPEPATLFLFSIGLLGTGLVRRRRR